MNAYLIREWEDRYEVNDKNGLWKPGQNKRSGPLEYIRMPAHGRSWSTGYRTLLKLAGKDAAAAFGVFTKALELAADNIPEYRGYLVDQKGVPLTADAIADMCGLPESVVSKALNILCDNKLGWLSVSGVPWDSGISAEVRGIPCHSHNHNHSQKHNQNHNHSQDTTSPADSRGELSVSAKSVFNAWNDRVKRDTTGNVRIAEARVLTDSRREHLNARLKEPFFCENWEEAMDRVFASNFCNGLNEKRWVANFDWFIKPNAVVRQMERPKNGGIMAYPDGIHVGDFDGFEDGGKQVAA